MMDSVLYQLLVLFGTSALCIYLFSQIRLSTIPGFLMAGVLIGPGGLGLIRDISAINVLAEIGVMLLLFSLGLEFSLARLNQMRSAILVTGGAQVTVTLLAAAAVAIALGVEVKPAAVIGGLISLSSTALVLRLLLQSQETDAIQGRITLAVLIFQDLCILPMMLFLPWLASGTGDAGRILWALLQSAVVIAAVIFAARMLFPVLLDRMARNKELFIVGSLFLFLGSAYVADGLGFSMQIGAFLAGLMISESVYSQQIFAEFRPLRDGLNSLFFVSIGMLVNPAFLIQHLPLLGLYLLAVLVGKAFLAALVVWFSGYPLRVALLSGALLAQIGEFSFVLVREADKLGLITPEMQQIVIATAALSMVATLPLVGLARRLSDSPKLARLERIRRRRVLEPVDRVAGQLRDHVVICGFGLNGRNLAQALAQNQIPFVAMDLNPDIVSIETAGGAPVVYGDCTSEEVLLHAGIQRARVVVLAVSDPFVLETCIPLIRRLSPSVFLLVRTKYVRDIDRLYASGASEVVTEEFEASMEIIFRTLRIYHLPRAVVAKELTTFREHGYETLRKRPFTVPRLRLDHRTEIVTESAEIPPHSALAGITVGESRLRSRTGALIIGILRDSETLSNPGPNTRLQVRDLLILVGSKNQLKDAMKLVEETRRDGKRL
ncbi:MAG: cation:proton antiporter [Acidobacteria bacterium]|nr:cation:proton antiporter [Acidobacteriota bacterium]